MEGSKVDPVWCVFTLIPSSGIQYSQFARPLGMEELRQGLITCVIQRVWFPSLILVTFVTTHIFQFRFVHTAQYCLSIIWYSRLLLSVLEEDLGSEVVFWFDEWFVAFGMSCHLARSGLMLVTFLTTQFFQFYFAVTVHFRFQVVSLLKVSSWCLSSLSSPCCEQQ